METVRGDRDANIMFTQCGGCRGLRVLLGGWANQKSFIRDEYRDPTGRDQTLVQVGLLNVLFYSHVNYVHILSRHQGY